MSGLWETCNVCGWRHHFSKMCKNKSQKSEKSISYRQQIINMTMMSMRNQDIPCSISGVREIIKMIRMW